MLHRVFLPQLGQTMEEGTVEKWHKQEGDQVRKGELLYELTTDKATLEVESFADGVLKKVLVAEGQTVPVNELIAVIGEPDDELPDDLDVLTEGAPAGVPAARKAEARPAAGASLASAATVARPTAGASSSPRARRIAEELEVPLGVLPGSGPDGRVVERDVRDYVRRLGSIAFTPTAKRLAFDKGVDLPAVAAEVGDRRVTKEDVERAVAAGIGVGGTAAGVSGQRVALSPMRRTIAQRMASSKQTVPHFYLVGEVLMREALAMLKRASETAGKVTVTGLLVKAIGVALRENPKVNCRFDGDAVVLNEACNVGVAVAVDDGLFVPVIKRADGKGLQDISAELRSLAEAARAGKLIPEQYEGGSVTLSNLGMYGVDAFLPIINPPESCIVGVGRIAERVVAHEGGIQVEPVMQVTVSADHRATDGAKAAQFFQSLKAHLEAPDGLAG